MEIWHVTLTADRDSRLPLFSDESAYLEGLHRLGRVCAGRLALFCLIAEHVHLVAALSRVAAGGLAKATRQTLGPVVPTPLGPSHFTAVTRRSHLRWLLQYVLTQPVKHRMPGHPALWVGSCLPDLLGARLIPRLLPRIREILPDYRDSLALELVGLGDEPLAPASREAIRAAGAWRLVSATRAAVAVPAPMGRNTPAARLGRRAVVEVARRVGIAARDVAAALSVSIKTVWRLRGSPVPRDLLLVVARRIALEDRVTRVIGARPAALLAGGSADPRSRDLRPSSPGCGVDPGRDLAT